MAPRVSICIPTHDGARWIAGAVASALAQPVDLELLVVDDRSSDDTVDRVRAFDDPRLRVVELPRQRGLPGSWNACLDEARGELIKLLFQDDLLYPDCLPKMTALLDEQPTLGLVFCRRDLIDAAGEPVSRVGEALAHPHRGFARLERTNHGLALYDQLLSGWFRENWIGEPTAVLVHKACFERVGRFNERLRQVPDLEMWARILCRYDAGFVDAPLCAFRVHDASATAANVRRLRHWLDPLWLAEGLRASEHVPDSPRLRALRYLGLARAAWLRGRCLHPGSLTPATLVAQARELYEATRYLARGARGASGDSRRNRA